MAPCGLYITHWQIFDNICGELGVEEDLTFITSYRTVERLQCVELYRVNFMRYGGWVKQHSHINL